MRILIVRRRHAKFGTISRQKRVRHNPRGRFLGIISGSKEQTAEERGGLRMRDINQISAQIIDAAMKMHSALGRGLLESAYRKRSISFQNVHGASEAEAR